MTLLDFPGFVACTVFLPGCNLRCPFCHNASLACGTDDGEISKEYILNYLRKRKGLIDGVCFTGGEPLLNKDIGSFMEEIKALGFKIKLDTNGTRPQILKKLVKNGLVDYVAMDIKNSKSKYAETVGVKELDFTPIKESIDFLLSDSVDYEFRTTVVDVFHTPDSIEAAARIISGAKRYFLQCFVDSGELIDKINQMSAVNSETMNEMKKRAEKYVQSVGIRGL